MKMFVSTGFKNRGQYEVREDIDRATDWFNKRYAFGEVVHNYDCVKPEQEHVKFERIWYVSEAIKKIADCELVYFCEGWQNHTGCLVEYEVAKLYKIPMVFEE